VQQKFGLLEQQDSLAIEFFSLQPTNIPSNRNVALHACSIGPPWLRWCGHKSSSWWIFT